VDDESVAIEGGQTLANWRALDMRRGVRIGEWRQRTSYGRIIVVRKLRLASLANRALAVQLTQIEVTQPCGIALRMDIQPTPGLHLVKIAPGL
jgi:trehalose/maltose hydrolase-like predicted phosphorylase